MKFAPYTSGRLKGLNIGITSYSEGKTSLNVVGNVGIGTKDPYAAVGAGNTSVLAVGILTANRIYSTVFGEFTGGTVTADNIVGSALSISGIATIGGNVAIGTDDPNAVVGTSNTAILAVGILTANRIYSTVFGEFTGGSVVASNIVGSALSISGISTFNGQAIFNGNVTLGNATSDSIGVLGRFSNDLVPSSNGDKDLGLSSRRWRTLHVKNILQSGGGISTFTNDINANGNIVGDSATNISGISSVTATNFFGTLQTAAQPNITSVGTLGALKVSGISTLGITSATNLEAQQLNVTGVSTLGITSATNLEAQQLNVTGVSTFSDNLNLPDNKKIQLGDSSDLQLYHSVSGSGSTSYIDNNTGPLYIRNNVDNDDGGNIIIEAKSGKASAVFQDDEGVRLYYNDAEKIATTGYGVTVNGTTQTQQLNVSGISTLGNTVVGGATTQLLVTGDARVTGEFKVGDGTIILNDAGVSTFPKTVNIGPVSISTVTATTFPFDVQVGGSGDIKLFGGTGIVSATAFYGSGIGLTDISIPGINTSATSNFTNFRVTGVSTLGTVQVSSGIITATSGVVTYFGDGSNLTGTGVGATDSVNTTGIVTASAFSGHGYLQAPYGSTVNFNVTVASKSGHRYQGQGSGQAYVINGVQSPVLTLTPGRTYRFTLSSSDMGSHPFRFYYEADRTTAYTTNVTTTATYAEITVTDTTPNVLHYQCLYHGYMGNSVVTNSNVVDSPYVTTHRKGLNVTSGVSTFAGNVSVGSSLLITTNKKAVFGPEGDLEINSTFASGSGGSYFKTNAGPLVMGPHSSFVVTDKTFTQYFLEARNGAVDLWSNGSKKFSTTGIGASVLGQLEVNNGINVTSGVITATTLKVDGTSTFAGNLDIADTIYHTGDSNTKIRFPATDTITFHTSGAERLRINSIGDVNISGTTTTGNFSVTGISTFTGQVGFGTHITLPDNAKVILGDGPDLSLFHDGFNSFIQDTGTGQLRVQTSELNVVTGFQNSMLKATPLGSVKLYYGASNSGTPAADGDTKVKLETTGYGVTVNGQLEVNNGINVTSGVSTFAGNITANGNIVGDSATNISGINSVTATSFFGNGQGLTNITADTVGDLANLKVTGLSTFVGNAQFDGNVSIGGTLTYEDVTNVDSIGVITARSGIVVGAGISAVGVITATSFSGDGQDLDKVSIGSTDGNFIGKGYLQAQKTVNAGGSRGNANIILGRFAGCCHDGGSYNVYLGDQAGRKSTGSNTDRNVFIGCQAGCGNTNGYHNVFLGSEAGKGVCGDSGSVNLFAGLQAGMRNTGCYNIAFGKASYGRETGTKNISIGYMAANDVGAGGTSNVFIGDCAGYNAQVNGPPFRGGMSNVYLGTAAGYQNPGDFNIGIGDNSLNGNASVTAGCRNIALGQCSGNDIQSGVDNIFLGSCAGAKITTGSCNILLGYNSGCNATGSFRNVYVGTNVGKNVCGGAYDVALGSENLCDSKWACNNIAIGKNIFKKANCQGPSADALFNIGIGEAVGTGLTTGGYNLMLGYQGGYCLTCACDNIIFGKKAGWKASESTKNIFIGCYAGRSSVSAGCAGQANIAIGNLAGSQTSSTSDRNIFIGNRAGVEATGGCFNIALGADAGSYVTGDRNIFLGQYSGFTQNVSGDKNVVIGDAVCLLSATGSTQLVIGAGATHWIDGDSSFNVTLAGIATAYSATGIVSATKFCGDGSCLTGISAGFQPDADENLVAGTQAGANLDGTSGCFNLLLGACAGQSVTSGANNTFFGTNSGKDTTIGSFNFFGGYKAAEGNIGGACNVYIGNQVGYAATGGEQNIALGQKTAYNNSTGSYNISFGTCASYCLSSGTANVTIGKGAGFNVSSGNCNVLIGRDAGKCVTTGVNNIFVGTSAGNQTSNNTNYSNVGLGFIALCSLTTGGCNFAGGSYSGSSITTGSHNITIGEKSGQSIDIAIGNIFLGQYTGCGSCGSTGCNIFIGHNAGKNATTTVSNIAIGMRVQLPSATDACQLVIGVCNNNWIVGNSDFNVGIGTTNPNAPVGVGNTAKLSVGIVSAYQLYGDGSNLSGVGFNPDADENLVAGTCAGINLDGSAGCFNILLGACAGCNVTSGPNNIFLGSCAGKDATSADCNIALGYRASRCMETGTSNIALGSYSGGAFGAGVSGRCNVAIGHQALQQLIGGHCNVAIGMKAGAGGGPGSRSIAIGACAGWCGIKSDDTIAIGFFTGCKTDANGCGIFIGRYAGRSAEAGKAIMIGCEAGRCAVDAENSIFIGSAAGKCACNAADGNLFIGQCAGRGSSTLADNTGDYNIAFGQNAMLEFTSASDNVVIGRNAGCKITSGSHNIALGTGSLECCMSAGLCNVAIGMFAGRKLQNDCNIAIGTCALFGSGGGIGYCNIAIGLNAGRKLTNGHANIFIGTCAGNNITGSGSADGSYNIGFGHAALGAQAAGSATSGNFNAVMGFYSGAKISSGSNNTLMGRSSGENISSGGSNTFLGNGAGKCVSTGSNNIALGVGAGKCISTGSKNIAIGVNAIPPSITGSCQLVIGIESSYWMVGNCDFNVGIGTTNPNAAVGAGNTAKLSVGIVSAYQLYGDGSNLSGVGFSQDAQCNLIAGLQAGACADADTQFNIILGCAAGKRLDSGDHNVILGTHSGKCATGGNRNTLIGMCAGTCVADGSCNVFIGNYTGVGLICTNNIAIGCMAGCGSATTTNNTGVNNIFLGSSAGKTITSGSNNILLGQCTGYNVSSGCKNILIGTSAGKCVTTGYCNIFIGQHAGEGDATITGYRNTVVGDCAAYGIQAGYYNVVFGFGAGFNLENDIGNTLIGVCAGRAIRYEDNYNTFIGHKAGRLQQGGCGNVIIGACIDRVPFYCDTGGSANEGCQLIIGYESNVWLSGNKDWNVGIGTTNTKTELQVGSHYGVSSGMGTFTAAAGVAHTINEYTIASTDFKTAEYTIFAGIGSDIQSQKLLVMQDGTTAYSQEYAVMSSDTLLVSASATLASGVVKVEITPETGVSGLTTFRFTRHTML